MKIKCEKCGKDITIACATQIEGYGVGRIKCPHCHTQQKRYLSEADILLFFGTNELLYTIFTYICKAVFQFKAIWAGAVAMLGICVIYYFVSKYVATYIYVMAPFKNDIMNKVFEENASQIKKALTWQFMLFFTIVISGLTLESEVNKYFLYILPLIPLISFIKVYFQIKYEKKK